jgi:hypothetical protein
MFYARRRAGGDAAPARLPDTIARPVEFTLAVTDGRGRTRTSRFRVLTTLLDHYTDPARQIAALLPNGGRPRSSTTGSRSPSAAPGSACADRPPPWHARRSGAS